MQNNAESIQPLPDYLSGIAPVSEGDKSLLPAAMESFSPLLIKSAMKNWPLATAIENGCNADDKLRLFDSLLEDGPVRFTQKDMSEGGDLGFGPDLLTRNAQVASADYGVFRYQLASSVSDKKILYLQSRPIDASHEVSRSILRMGREANLSGGRVNLWIGSGGQVVNLHHDDSYNLLCLFEGTKRIVLFPPSASASLYPAPLDGPLGAPASHVKLLRPDFLRFPRLTHVIDHALLAIVERGDVLFMPPLWWHHVESFGLNIMINGWFDAENPASSRHELRSLIVAGIAIFASMTDKQREYCRRLYHHYLFAAGEEELKRPPPPSLPASVQNHLRKSQSVIGGLHRSFRANLEHLFDYFAFQTDGTPMSWLPGEFDNMVSRFRSRASTWLDQ